MPKVRPLHDNLLIKQDDNDYTELGPDCAKAVIEGRLILEKYFREEVLKNLEKGERFEQDREVLEDYGDKIVQ